MSTKFYSTARRKPYNPYDSPYDAFINYMNVLSDFSMQLQKVDIPEAKVDVSALEMELLEKDRQLKIAKLQLDKWRTTFAKTMQDDEKIEQSLKKRGRPKKKPENPVKTKETVKKMGKKEK
jgi:alpha-amylase